MEVTQLCALLLLNSFSRDIIVAVIPHICSSFIFNIRPFEITPVLQLNTLATKSLDC